MKWATTINFILGLWLIVAAFAVSHAMNPAMSVEIAVGIAIAGLSGAAAFTPVHEAAVLSWIVTLSGLWMLVAPFVVGYAHRMSASASNDAIVGIIVIVLGCVNTVTRGTRLAA
jgi:hypothetical protein